MSSKPIKIPNTEEELKRRADEKKNEEEVRKKGRKVQNFIAMNLLIADIEAENEAGKRQAKKPTKPRKEANSASSAGKQH